MVRPKSPDPVNSSARQWQRLMAEANAPGLAMASIRHGRLDGTRCLGVRGVQVAAPVNEDTVFKAASLSKPVFAHAWPEMMTAVPEKADLTWIAQGLAAAGRMQDAEWLQQQISQRR